MESMYSFETSTKWQEVRFLSFEWIPKWDSLSSQSQKALLTEWTLLKMMNHSVNCLLIWVIDMWYYCSFSIIPTIDCVTQFHSPFWSTILHTINSWLMHSNSTPLPLWNYPLELLQNSYWMVTSFPHPFHYHHSFTTTNHYESRSSYSIQAKASSHLYTSRNYCTNSHNWGHRKESVPFALLTWLNSSKRAGSSVLR